jgi:hypothetical protein
VKAAALSLVVLTLNVAGPRRVHQGWPTRREAIAAALKGESADVVALQEVWRDQDVAALSEAAGTTSAASDEALGLAVLLRGWRPNARARLDLGGGYGALRVEATDGRRTFDVYTARLEAGEGAAAARRLGQLFELAEFVRTQSAGRPFVLLGGLGASADDKDAALFLDLVEGRDLCVAHGDEVCGRTLPDRREDFAVIPYAAQAPRETARTFLNQPLSAEDEEEPVSMRFGLHARLDAGFFKLKPAAEPAGRAEALTAVADSVERARVETQRALARAGWLPFLGTRDELRALDEDRRLEILREAVRSAQIRASAAPAAP